MSAPRTCECMTCRKCYERERARKVYRLRTYGRWDPHGDLEAVRAHLENLRAHRVGIKRISELTGISRNTAYRIRAGKAKRVTREVADLILSVQPDQTLRINPIGTARRIRALMAIGWSTYEQAERLGMTQANLWELSKARTWVSPETFAAVRDLFDELSMTLGPSEITRTRAAVSGHPPPLAWDNIDDPNERPKGVGTSRTDRADVLTDIDSWGGNATDACRILGIKRDSLQTWCSDNGCSELYRRLAGREAMAANQYAKGDVA